MGSSRPGYSPVFPAPSDSMRNAIERLKVDVGEVKDMRFADFVADRVLPALMDDTRLEAELEAQADRGFGDASATVGALLDLDGDIRYSETFSG
jgi:hypothetical protein